MWFSLLLEQTCPRCGAKAPHDSVSCPMCGYWLYPMSYLPVLTVVILVALLDVGLIAWHGVPHAALTISASELPPVAVTASAATTAAAVGTTDATLLAVDHADAIALPPTPVAGNTPAAVATALPTATTLPTTMPTATAMASPTATVPATPTAPPTTTAVATATATGEPTATVAATATMVPTATVPPAPTATASPVMAPPPADGAAPNNEQLPGGTTLVSLDVSAGDPAPAEALLPLDAVTPVAAVPAEGVLWLRNYIGSELVVTVTSQDVVWATTFRIAAMGETTVALVPGHYTFTASPLGSADKHGDFELDAGQKLELPIVG